MTCSAIKCKIGSDKIDCVLATCVPKNTVIVISCDPKFY